MGYGKHEIQTVKMIGDSIGYGRMMSIASALWAIKLKDEHHLPESGAFIPTIDSFLIDSEKERSKKERAWHIEEIRKLL